MHVHRLCTWEDQVLGLSPTGGATKGSTLAKSGCLEVARVQSLHHAVEPMPTACWRARNFLRRRRSLTTPGVSASR